MRKSHEVTRKNKTAVADPYLVLAWRKVEDWVCWFPESRAAADEMIGQLNAAGVDEIRLMSASMIMKWGPLDPGGLFNHETRKKRESHVPSNSFMQQPKPSCAAPRPEPIPPTHHDGAGVPALYPQ